MKRLVECFCLVAVLCYGARGSTISIDPLAKTAILGSQVSLNVNVSGIADLYAFQFDIAFDPSTLSAVSVMEGSVFNSVGVLFSPGFIDNVGGSITFIGDSLSGPGPGLSMDGTLAHIVFNSVGIGGSSVDLANITLLDSSLNDITVGTSGATVTITGALTVPEPSSGVLLAIALGVIGIAVGKRGQSQQFHLSI